MNRKNLLYDNRRRYVSTRNLHISGPIWAKFCREKLHVVLSSHYAFREHRLFMGRKLKFPRLFYIFLQICGKTGRGNTQNYLLYNCKLHENRRYDSRNLFTGANGIFSPYVLHISSNFPMQRSKYQPPETSCHICFSQ